jgi:PIN domain nuclease of toxin-antitoxin system
LSVVTVWELQIKIALNKFTIKGKLENAVKDEQQNNGFQILPIQVSHALYLENLPPHHKDPFDRLLISQAIVENMTLVSADTDFAKYQVNLLW